MTDTNVKKQKNEETKLFSIGTLSGMRRLKNGTVTSTISFYNEMEAKKAWAIFDEAALELNPWVIFEINPEKLTSHMLLIALSSQQSFGPYNYLLDEHHVNYLEDLYVIICKIKRKTFQS